MKTDYIIRLDDTMEHHARRNRATTIRNRNHGDDYTGPPATWAETGSVILGVLLALATLVLALAMISQ
jgi:hypothetical protein